MSISIDFLKDVALNVYKKVNPLLGRAEAAAKRGRGAGGDMSMEIDIIAEKIIINALKQRNVNLLLISEEIGEIYIGDKAIAKESQQKLIVDPIDGSTNSIRGIPFCCISIAYAEGNQLDDIEKAVVLDLTTKDIYWAEKGKGAYFND